jgi:hypothetical protein
MSDPHSFSARSWFDVYQTLCTKADAARGMRTLTLTDTPTVSFPSTTAQDAYAIALVFDQAVHDHASEAFAERWELEMELLAREVDNTADAAIYVGNRSLWELLAAAATELDDVRAALPSHTLMEDAIHALATPRPPAAEPRNAAMTVAVFSAPTWRAMALRQLEFFRRLRGVDRSAPLVPSVPRTGNADVLALAEYWTEQLMHIGRSAHDTYHRLVCSCWREVLDRVMCHAQLASPLGTYAHNEEFWTALILLATQSDTCDEHPSPWAFYIPTSPGQRNAAPVDTGTTLDFPSAATWDEAARMQRDAFSRLRGEDKVTGRLIGRVPRTTVSDVRQLAAYWSSGLAKVGAHNFADISYRHVLDRWNAALAELDRLPGDTDPATVYQRNVEFWEALLTIAIQVAVTAEAPTRWTLIKEAAKHAVDELPSLTSRLLGKPLLYAGIGLGGLAALVYALRRPTHSETHA